VNDIEKLHQVINALEEQSAHVSEFNGVLSAVRSARDKIESLKSTLTSLTDEQKVLVSESYKRFDEYGLGLTKLETEVTLLSRKIDITSAKLNSTTKSLRMLVSFEVILLVGVIVLLVKDHF
jgi:uncharacterized coiled-coil DUF342 family protein